MVPIRRIPRLLSCTRTSLLRAQLPPHYARLIRASTTLTPPPQSTPLPAYEPPKTGFISHLPSPLIPYAELVRLDQPTGTIYLLLPCLWSTLLAGTLTLSPISSILTTSLLFTSGALIMRGAGCTINDLWDRRIDVLVSRTRHRPLARGALSPTSAVLFTGGQLLAGLGVLLQFPAEVVVTAIPSLLLVATYPGMKRITHYPQVVLGMAFSWGAVLGFPALGMTLLEPATATVAGLLYASNVAWTVCYDTVYAQQDMEDDKKVGVKSTAVAQEGRTRTFLGALAAAQVGFLGAAGAVAGLGPVFWVWSIGGAAAGLTHMIRKVRLEDKEECGEWFRWCAWAVGGVAVGGGLTGEYVWRRVEVNKNNEAEMEAKIAAE